MTDTLRPAKGVQEVDTEYEDDADELQDSPYEVEEELDAEATLPARSDDAVDYTLPEENRDVWKNFGYETEAGRALRRLYAGPGQKGAAARVSYPRMKSAECRWEPKSAPQKPCPQRARVQVPHGRRPSVDRDDPRFWRAPIPGRKPEAEILAEMEAHRPEKPRMKAGRDQIAEKHNLQDKFRYAGGSAMPKGAMGHVPAGEVPDPAACRRPRPESWDHIDETGLTKEQRGLFTDMTAEIQDKQNRLAQIDAQDAADAKDAKPTKAKTQRNKEALQLQNDIAACIRDMDRLLEISE